MKEDYQKAFKKLTLFFLLSPDPFNEQSYQKQKGSGASDQLLFRLQHNFKNIPVFIIYFLTKFYDELFKKLHLQIYAHQLVASSIIPIPFALLNLEKVEKKGKNFKNLNISRMKRAFYMK